MKKKASDGKIALAFITEFLREFDLQGVTKTKVEFTLHRGITSFVVTSTKGEQRFTPDQVSLRLLKELFT